MRASEFILGEFRRTIDERYRLSIPAELADPLTAQSSACILAKERPGALSLWSAADWQERLSADIELVERKMQAGRLEGRVEQVQMLGRLLSTRHKEVELTGRGRLLIPEGFRQFLTAQPGDEVFVVGAAVCVEIWRPESWVEYLNQQMPDFRQLLDSLSG
jgi:MraZ protein